MLERRICTLKTAQKQRLPSANPFRRSLRAGHFAISSWLDFPCSFRLSLGYRLASLRVAADRLANLFLALPALYKPFRRSHYSLCWCPFPFLESAFALPSPRFFCTVCCRSFATPRPVCRTSREHCASRQLRWDSVRRPVFGNLSADGVALHLVRNQDQRCDKCRHCHAGRIDRRRRFR